MKIFKAQAASLVNYLFQTLLVTYLVLLLLEQIQQGFVSVHLNLNYLLIIVIIVGILDVFSDHEKPEYRKPDFKDYSLIALLGVAGFLIIKFKTAELQLLSWVISAIAGILIILLSLLILEENDEQ